MKILLTGTGFIGKFLIKEFLKDKHQVVGIYRKNKPALDTEEKTNIRLVELDLKAASPCLEAFDVIIHTAAASPDPLLMPSVDEFISSNVQGTLRMADYAKKAAPRIFVYLSSISIYGNVLSDCVDHKTVPHSPDSYGLSKYLAEAILEVYSDFFPTICLRLPGVVGPGNFKAWLGDVLLKARRGQDINIYNPEVLFNNVFDLYELKRFVSELITKKFCGFDAVNLAASEPITIKEVVEYVVSQVGSDSRICEQKANKCSFCISIDKLENKYGFTPLSTKELICRYINENAGICN